MPFEATCDRRVVRIACAGARIDDEIHRWQLMLMLAKRFPNETFDAIATHGIPDDAGGDRQSKAGNRRTGVARKYREQSVGRAACITIHAIEFGFLSETLRGFERPSGRQAHETKERERAGADERAYRSDSETLATFRAAPCENLTTRSGGHAGAKAVSALTVQIARLVSTLHAGSRCGLWPGKFR